MKTNPIPPYKKWFDSESEYFFRMLSEGNTYTPGKKIDEHSDGRTAGPPSSSSDSFEFSHNFEVPFKENEAGEQPSLVVDCPPMIVPFQKSGLMIVNVEG